MQADRGCCGLLGVRFEEGYLGLVPSEGCNKGLEEAVHDTCHTVYRCS